MLNREAVLVAIHNYVLYDLKYKANPQNYMPQRHNMAQVWEQHLNDAEAMYRRIKEGENIEDVLVGNNIPNTPGAMLRMILNGYKGAPLESDRWEIRNGFLLRVQHEDPYRDVRSYDYY